MRNTLGGTIEKYRKIRGMTQKELADKISISRSFISQIESGISNPSDDTLKKIANELGVSVTDLTNPVSYLDEPISKLVNQLIELTEYEYIHWEQRYRNIEIEDNRIENVYTFTSSFKDGNDTYIYEICIFDNDKCSLNLIDNHERINIVEPSRGFMLNNLIDLIFDKLESESFISKQIKILDGILDKLKNGTSKE